MTPLDKAFEEIQQLVKKFSDNIGHYMSTSYSEAEARQDFIDDFFISLGWDVRHKEQTNPYEQEVKIEKSQKQQNESARKRADYAFFIGPNYKEEVFFAEAKKPSVLIQGNPQHYFQTIKYGWNSGCAICVLTDFEELAIIDCRQKPDIRYALNGKHKTYRYTDYSDKEKFAEIYWLFSREAVANNSLQKYAAQLPKAKGKVVQKALFKGAYQAIDDSFLEYIDGIRENIAKAFKKANENLNSEQLTEATQRTVDRLVFIRFLEDKFIEAEEHVTHWTSWKDFISDCRKLDAKYNGVVFKKNFIDEPHFLGADESLFLEICSDISNLNSPYDFNYIPIHILGSIYERFLGKIVRATDKRVFIEEKPEVRKAGGVYYTPKYIVDYIVKNSVGQIIDGLTPKLIAGKHFADIACGSGSFLIGVYDYLLDYHKKYYMEKLKDKTEIDARSEDYSYTEYKDGQWVLTLKLKQEILLNNIYGVDIDAQAVEVTQLSLFLKMLEDENISSTKLKQGALFSKVLPDLSKNIVCGNSLIGFDIMDGQLFEDDELKKLNPMDYETAFTKIMNVGGFDAIVGNPPYGADFSQNSLPYIKNNFTVSQYNLDSYYLFLEKAINKIKDDGILGYIIPNTWLLNIKTSGIRKFIINNYDINLVVNFLFKVFKDAVVDTQVLCLKKGLNPKMNNITIEVWKNENDHEQFKKKQTEWISLNGRTINILERNEYKTIRDKLNKLPILDIEYKITQGTKPFQVGKGKPKQTKQILVEKPFVSVIKVDESFKPLLRGSMMNKYLINWNKDYWIKFGDWLAEPRYSASYDAIKKIIIRQTGDSLIATIDKDKFIVRDNLYTIVNKNASGNLYYLLSLLNSKLLNWIYQKLINPEAGEALAQVKRNHIASLPIPKINFSIPTQKEFHDKLAELATNMLESKKQLATSITDNDKNFLQNKCNSLDRQIDKLVYNLYELTEEEIKIIEENL